METYGQFCAIARGLEVIGQRWTLLVVRELLCGSTRFNEIRRGIPLIPRSTLVERLAALERAGVVDHDADDGAYSLSDAGRALAPVMAAIATWTHQFDRRGLTDDHLDPDALLWDMRRRLDADALPSTRTVVAFTFTDRAAGDRRLYLHLGGREVALCRDDVGVPPDLEVSGTTAALARWWLGELTWRQALAQGVSVTGPTALRRAFPHWFAGYVFPATG
jgi:DNA-binding HxlR family transcriptional regulator